MANPVRTIPPEDVLAIIDRYRHVDPMEAMIPVLQEVQVKYGFITEAVVNMLAEEIKISVTEIYGVITFYSFFRFSPAGGRIMLTCEGTSCYVRGAGRVREAIDQRLNIAPGQTTADGRLSFEPMSVCLGACDLGPLVEIEGRYYTHVTPEKMNAIIDEWLAYEEDGHAEGHGDLATAQGVFGPTAAELGSALPFEGTPGPAQTGMRTKG
jgi:NADH:ubiquinone oxidoreductase subunit E